MDAFDTHSIPKLLEHAVFLHNQREIEITLLQEEIVDLRDRLSQLQQEHPGHVVLTKRGDTDELILVSRQDDEGHILSVLWEKPEPIRTETPTQMMDDMGSYCDATKHQPLD